VHFFDQKCETDAAAHSAAGKLMKLPFRENKMNSKKGRKDCSEHCPDLHLTQPEFAFWLQISAEK